MAVQTKNSRIDLRLDANDKDTLEYAASLNRLSLSSYILSKAIEAAKLDIEKEETLKLTNNQRDKILLLLDSPNEPTEALMRLFK